MVNDSLQYMALTGFQLRKVEGAAVRLFFLPEILEIDSVVDSQELARVSTRRVSTG